MRPIRHTDSAAKQSKRNANMVYPHIHYQGPAYPDRPGSETPTGTRELDSRISDGIHVRLLWHTHDGLVSVAVRDNKTGEAFELPVPAGARPLDVYHHPYAYAGVVRPASAPRGPLVPRAPADQAGVNSRSARSQFPSSSEPDSSRWMK